MDDALRSVLAYVRSESLESCLMRRKTACWITFARALMHYAMRRDFT